MQKTLKNIPMLDLTAQYKQIKSEIEEGVLKVLESGNYILGEIVEDFENLCCDYLKVKYAIGVNSGTDALQLTLMAYGIKPQDEVITTCFSFFATSEVISIIGAKPVFVDIDSKTFNIDVNQIKNNISKKTRAIIPVHLYGQPADMDEILEIAEKYNLAVIEDCAQSFGAKYKDKYTGTIGNAGAFSFYPTKNLGACGDAGLVVTNDEEIANKIRNLRAHGSKAKKYYYDYIGMNSRLDAVQAAILKVKLKYIDTWNAVRKEIARRYIEKLNTGIIPPFIKEDREHIFHQFTVKVKDRNDLQNYLKTKGISTFIYYPLALHLQQVYKDLGYTKDSFPVAYTIQNKVLSLPIFPELKNEEIDYAAECINEFYKS